MLARLLYRRMVLYYRNPFHLCIESFFLSPVKHCPMATNTTSLCMCLHWSSYTMILYIPNNGAKLYCRRRKEKHTHITGENMKINRKEYYFVSPRRWFYVSFVVVVCASERTLWMRIYWMSGMCAHSWRVFNPLSLSLSPSRSSILTLASISLVCACTLLPSLFWSPSVIVCWFKCLFF